MSRYRCRENVGQRRIQVSMHRESRVEAASGDDIGVQTACLRSSYTPALSPRNASALRPLPPTSISEHTPAKLIVREGVCTPFMVTWTRHRSTLPLHRYLGTPLLRVPHIDTWTLLSRSENRLSTPSSLSPGNASALRSPYIDN